MSNFYNEDGEPLMSGEDMRREMYYDSLYESDSESYYENEPDEVNPAYCDHGDKSFDSSDMLVYCDICFVSTGAWVMGDDDWPVEL